MHTVSLTLEGLGCLRGGRIVFSGIDLALGPGGAALVSGPNGSGKTSLLRTIAGLLPPFAGTVSREGRIVFAGEAAALDADRPLARALRFWARLDGGGEAETRRGLEAMGLDRLAEVPVRMLSAGQLKRAGLARVIAGGAPTWLLDEPANGLDAESRARLERAMAAHRAAGGIVVAATHQPLALPEAQKLAMAA